jgi:hypothetical protein
MAGKKTGGYVPLPRKKGGSGLRSVAKANQEASSRKARKGMTLGDSGRAIRGGVAKSRARGRLPGWLRTSENPRYKPSSPLW